MESFPCVLTFYVLWTNTQEAQCLHHHVEVAQDGLAVAVKLQFHLLYSLVMSALCGAVADPMLTSMACRLMNHSLFV